jgi:uncharacterized protein YebE (UPF0316 family)
MNTLFALPFGPLLIFAMRAVDVSMGTIRMLVMLRGNRLLAASIGFVEVVIWVLAAGQALQHLDSVYHIVGYAGGFAAGNYLGVTLERWIGLGTVVVRVIVPDTADRTVARQLREAGYAVTEIEGHGRDGPVDILNAVVKRKHTSTFIAQVEAIAPQAFVTVEEVRSAQSILRPLPGAVRR